MLRDYQIEPVNNAFQLLQTHKVCYLNGEMRTGKTTMALTLADRLGCRNVLFVTTKKVVIDHAVEKDFEREGFNFELTVINYEQIHKLNPIYDFIIADEAHKFGAFPKPAQRTKALRQIVGSNYLVLMSGTSNPESMSQLFHQFWLTKNSPFSEPNFYKWAKNYVDIKDKFLGTLKIKDYSKAKEDEILKTCGFLFVKLSQEKAGFKINELTDTIIEIDVDPKIQRLVNDLCRDKYYRLKNGDEIVCDSPASLQGKIHQIYSGTVIGENKAYILDNSKARYIKENYKTEKIVIFYKYIAEGDAVKELHANEWTDIPNEFNSNKKRIFISQIQSGSTGVNLSSADIIIFYNIDYSYVLYSQARARMQSLERTKEAKIHWLFAKNGIEHKIFDVVQKKRDYSLFYFKRDFIKYYVSRRVG